MMTAVGFSSIFPFLPLYVEELGTRTNLSTELLAGLVFSGQAFTMMLASPIWGALADRYGRKLMVERSMFGGAILLLLMAFVRSAEELVLLRTVQGLITGTVAAANALIAASVPRDRMGYAMGLLQVGLGSGVALGPVIGGAVADVYGYRVAFYATAALLFLSGVLVWRGVKETRDPDAQQVAQGQSLLAGWRHILSASGVLVTYSMTFFSQMGRMMIVPIAPLFILSLMPGSPHVNTFTGLVVGVTSATTTLSAIFLGRLGDRIGHRGILITCLLIAALLYLPQSMVQAAWQLLVLQALVGVALGGVIPAIGALLAGFTKSGEEGAVYGLDNSINSGGRAVAPVLGGIVGAGFGLRATFTATAIIYLLAGILAAWRLPQTKKVSRPELASR